MTRVLAVCALLVLYLSGAPRLLARRHAHPRCPACGYEGCDGSLSQCTERWR